MRGNSKFRCGWRHWSRVVAVMAVVVLLAADAALARRQTWVGNATSASGRKTRIALRKLNAIGSGVPGPFVVELGGSFRCRPRGKLKPICTRRRGKFFGQFTNFSFAGEARMVGTVCVFDGTVDPPNANTANPAKSTRIIGTYECDLSRHGFKEEGAFMLKSK